MAELFGTLQRESHPPRGGVDRNTWGNVPHLRWAVTPLAGVWIEICINWWPGCIRTVTPLAGVWIEISITDPPFCRSWSHPPRGGVDRNIGYTPEDIVSQCHPPRGGVDRNSKAL